MRPGCGQRGRGMREAGVDRDDFRAGRERGGPGGTCAPEVPPPPAPAPCCRGGPSISRLEGTHKPTPQHTTRHMQKWGGLRSVPGHDECALNPTPRGNSPLRLTTPPTIFYWYIDLSYWYLLCSLPTWP